MHTDKDLLIKGLKYIAYTIALMFAAPVVLYQAFRNEENPLFWLVVILGIILSILAIGMGFYSMKVIMDAIFRKKNP